LTYEERIAAAEYVDQYGDTEISEEVNAE